MDSQERLPVGTVKSRDARTNFIRLVIDFEPTHDQILSRLFSVGQPAVVAPLLIEAAQAAQQQHYIETARPYAAQAKALRLSSFFRIPEVWAQIDSDEAFLAWVETCPCLACGRPAPSIAAHVRRVASGAGTGIKPPYSAIPLCDPCHGTQHQKGESALGSRDQWDKWRIDTVVGWAWQALKDQLGFAHWYDVPPETLYAWAEAHDVHRFLPIDYLP